MTAVKAKSTKSGERLVLGFGLTIADLYDRAGLERFDAIFLTFPDGTKGTATAAAAKIDGPAIAPPLAFLFGEPSTNLTFARRVGEWLKSEAENRAAGPVDGH
jgi:hypothetical protein